MIPLVDSSRSRRRIRTETPWLSPAVRYTISGLALVATALAAYLTWTTLGQDTVAGCGGAGQADCDAVLSTVWSKYLGLPVSALGMGCYLAIFVVSLFANGRGYESSRGLGTGLAMLSLAAAGAAIWFVMLQVFEVQKFCVYCLAIHSCGLAIAGLVLWSALTSRSGQIAASHSAIALAGALPIGMGSTSRLPSPAAGPSLRFASLGAVIGLVLLIGGQVLLPPKTYDVSSVALSDPISLTSTANSNSDGAVLSTEAQSHVVNRVSSDDPARDEAPFDDAGDSAADDEPVDAIDDETAGASDADSTPVDGAPALKRELKFLDGTLKVDLYWEAILGSPEAEYVIVELLDYTCPHCREMHENIKLAANRYGDQLAIVVMPVPLELECNKQMPKTDPMHRGACRLSRLALSVAKADPSAFADFHNFLLANKDDVPSYSEAVVRAFRLVNRTKLRELTKSDEIESRIQNYIKLFAALSARKRTSDKPFGLPVQIVGNKVLTGKFETPEAMFEAWEEELGIQPL